MRKTQNKGLGKGLEALLASSNTEADGYNIQELSVHDIDPSEAQPRKLFDEEKLAALAESIKTHGVVQPIIVHKQGNRYKIVAGERRWRASRLAGLRTIPSIVKEYTSRDVMEIALIENIQREDLNPLEEAEAFQRLMTEYGLKQEEVAMIVGRSRSAIANSVRILTLTHKVQSLIIEGKLTSGHARTLVTVVEPSRQEWLAEQIIHRNLNVRDTEKLVRQEEEKKKQSVKIKEPIKGTIELQDLGEQLRDKLGTQVSIVGTPSNGKIHITYFSQEELERISEFILNKVNN